MPLDLRFQACRNWDLIFNSISVDAEVTGNMKDAGTPVTITSGFVFPVGSGYFEGDMNGSTRPLRILVSPDKQFIAGFAWVESWTGRRRDVAPTRQ